MKQTSNNKIVRVKIARECKLCSNIIPAGHSCRTINPIRGIRYWIHNECYKKYTKCEIGKQIEGSVIMAKNLPFGDDGGYAGIVDSTDNFISECCGECNLFERCRYIKMAENM